MKRRRAHAASARQLQRTRCQARTLHAIDIDNLLESPRSTDRVYIEHVLDKYRTAADYRPGDHVIVATGCNGLHALETELAWAQVAHRRRSGRDGADTLLIEELQWAATSRRFDRVVIGSGDHIFASTTQQLISAGLAVTVVATRSGLSRQLQHAAAPSIRIIH